MSTIVHCSDINMMFFYAQNTLKQADHDIIISGNNDIVY